MLLLDEATSALDSRTERSIMASLQALQKGRTALCVAHRLSTAAQCDQARPAHVGQARTCVYENGRVPGLLSAVWRSAGRSGAPAQLSPFGTYVRFGWVCVCVSCLSCTPS